MVSGCSKIAGGIGVSAREYKIHQLLENIHRSCEDMMGGRHGNIRLDKEGCIWKIYNVGRVNDMVEMGINSLTEYLGNSDTLKTIVTAGVFDYDPDVAIDYFPKTKFGVTFVSMVNFGRISVKYPPIREFIIDTSSRDLQGDLSENMCRVLEARMRYAKGTRGVHMYSLRDNDGRLEELCFNEIGDLMGGFDDHDTFTSDISDMLLSMADRLVKGKPIKAIHWVLKNDPELYTVKWEDDGAIVVFR